jgi:exosortase H (IPTLxxWG-CTERM-specific)
VNGRVVRFVAVFTGLVAGGFTLLSVRWVDARLVEPWAAWLAALATGVLDALGEDVVRTGTVIRGTGFSVRIETGCNGVEAMLLYAAAVAAYPARRRWKGAGLAGGGLALQAVNLVRVVSLYWTGAYHPELFDTVHTVVWQSAVVLAAAGLWVGWACGATPVRRRG